MIYVLHGECSVKWEEERGGGVKWHNRAWFCFGFVKIPDSFRFKISSNLGNNADRKDNILCKFSFSKLIFGGDTDFVEYLHGRIDCYTDV